MTKIIYIGGYGHSGSTLLDYLMTGSPKILGCGEVVSTIRTRKKKKCTCGRVPKDCSVWNFLKAGARINSHTKILDALVRNAGGRYSAIVDSSKTAWGALSSPFRLRYAFGEDFFLIHLTRQPTGACWSVVKRKNSKAKRAGRWLYSVTLRCAWTSLGWLVANVSCELFRLIYPQRYAHLRYEDLVRAPVEEIQVLLGRALPGVRWRCGDLTGGNNRHQLYGNSIRHSPLAIENVKEDLKWKTEMPAKYARMVLHFTSPLRLRYGY